MAQPKNIQQTGFTKILRAIFCCSTTKSSTEYQRKDSDNWSSSSISSDSDKDLDNDNNDNSSRRGLVVGALLTSKESRVRFPDVLLVLALSAREREFESHRRALIK